MQALFNRADWERLPPGFPAELIQGRLVKEPPPTYGHQRIAARVRFALLSILGPDRVPDTPADVLVDDTNVYQPDVVALRHVPSDETSYVGVPLLAVEVLSPSTRGRDLGVKTESLLRLGVAEVWLIDRERRTIEVRRREGRVVVREAEVARSEALPGFALCPQTLFSPPR
jgi:Uma2 family endonuclease